MAAASPRPLTIYLSLTSSPSTPRAQLILYAPSETSNIITASELRRRASQITAVPLHSIKLIFRGRVIPEKDTGDVVEEYKLEDGCVVHIMGKPSIAATTSNAGAGIIRPAGATVTLSNTNDRANNDVTSSSSTDGTTIEAAISKLRSSNDSGTYREGLSTAHKMLGNIINNPTEAKYRSIKQTNPAFLRRLGSLPGGSDILFAAGFVSEVKDDDVDGRVEYFILTPSADAWPRLVAARDEIGRVLSGMDVGAGTVQQNSNTNVAGRQNASASGAPYSNDIFPTGVGAMPDMSAVQSMLRDPTMLRNVMGMMNDPRVQNMMNNDPRFANNPMLQQSLRAIQSNPEMIQQISRMMGDPNSGVNRMMADMNASSSVGSTGADPFNSGPESMRRLMEHFQQNSQQYGGSSGGASFGAGAGGSDANRNSSTVSSSVGDDGNVNEMTEDEMIAEAIARSLREP